MSGRFVRLEPLSISDHLEGFFQLKLEAKTEERYKYLNQIPPKNTDELKAFWEERTKEGGRFIYIIVDRNTEKIVGGASYHHVEEAYGVAEIGVYFGDGLARKPGGTEMMYLMASHLFDELGYRR